ncbi:hypothetical protein [Arundinibacter roseus]|uniref:Uncharacterized protein n=1 Tax=Arundinibacter roseus TaxID=2070510 RepID=A0A4R4KQ85_9BACT|nr:hypothetical protein [Arundinibacter roseus]TDB69116.1 hypothetical protein EZE20_01915 [Arundinibacter roseus]
MDVQDEINKRFESEVVEVCDRIFTEGIRQMRYAMENAGLVLTEELKRSLYSERTFVSGQLEAQFRMGMRGYGRFKDMKKISYANFPNVDSLVEFIEQIGIEKFINNDTVTISGKAMTLFVPGYYINSRRRVAITTERATTRLAYALGRSMQDRNTLKRSKNPFYNINKGDIYNNISQYLMQKLPSDMMQALKEYYERPFYEKDQWWG